MPAGGVTRHLRRRPGRRSVPSAGVLPDENADDGGEQHRYHYEQERDLLLAECGLGHLASFRRLPEQRLCAHR
jgi:hypothetical protein